MVAVHSRRSAAGQGSALLPSLCRKFRNGIYGLCVRAEPRTGHQRPAVAQPSNQRALRAKRRRPLCQEIQQSQLNTRTAAEKRYFSTATEQASASQTKARGPAWPARFSDSLPNKPLERDDEAIALQALFLGLFIGGRCRSGWRGAGRLLRFELLALFLGALLQFGGQLLLLLFQHLRIN